MKIAPKQRHFIVLTAILMMIFFQSSSIQPQWNKIDLVVIDDHLGSEALKNESEFGVYVQADNNKDIRTVRAEMLIYMGYDVSITITSPYEPCGDASIVTYEFSEKGLKNADENYDFYLYVDKQNPQLLKFTIKTSEPLASAQHRALLSMFKFVEGDENNAERDILISQVMVYRNIASEVTLTDFLEYGTFTHKLEENRALELDFTYDLDNLAKGTVREVDVTWSPEGRKETPLDEYGWQINDAGELEIHFEGREWQKVKIKRVPETGESTFKGQPADDTFPQMWMQLDEKVWLSESTTSC